MSVLSRIFGHKLCDSTENETNKVISKDSSVRNIQSVVDSLHKIVVDMMFKMLEIIARSERLIKRNRWISRQGRDSL